MARGHTFFIHNLDMVNHLVANSGILASNALVHGNALNVLAHRDLLQARFGEATLAYLDPPFNTGHFFAMPDGRRAFADEHMPVEVFLDTVVLPLFEASWAYVAPGGVVALHLDQRSVHHARVRLDARYGARTAFMAEIIWRYRRWPTKTPNFQRVHDTILLYRKQSGGFRFKGREHLNSREKWNQLYEPLAASTVKTWGTRKQKAVIDAMGKRRRSFKTPAESPGVHMGDVWDLSIIAPKANERTGYPTQKPEKLLERLVLALTDPGDLVLDPCCGSGTTLAVAQKTGRRWLGVDSSVVAFEVARARLWDLLP